MSTCIFRWSNHIYHYELDLNLFLRPYLKLSIPHPCRTIFLPVVLFFLSLNWLGVGRVQILCNYLVLFQTLMFLWILKTFCFSLNPPTPHVLKCFLNHQSWLYPAFPLAQHCSSLYFALAMWVKSNSLYSHGLFQSPLLFISTLLPAVTRISSYSLVKMLWGGLWTICPLWLQDIFRRKPTGKWGFYFLLCTQMNSYC